MTNKTQGLESRGRKPERPVDRHGKRHNLQEQLERSDDLIKLLPPGVARLRPMRIVFLKAGLGAHGPRGGWPLAASVISMAEPVVTCALDSSGGLGGYMASIMATMLLPCACS